MYTLDAVQRLQYTTWRLMQHMHPGGGISMAEEKILVIEDDQGSAEMVADAMRERGYRPVIASDGLSGLDLALQERPDVILLDFQLPQMSGVQLLSELQRHKLNVPVIVTTALGSEELALLALRMGVRDYVKKPFSLPELVRTIERVLQGEHLRRERDELTARLVASNRRLKALHKVGQALTSTLDLDERLNVMLKVACHILGVGLTSVFVLDEQSGDLVFRLGTGEKADRLMGRRLRPGQGIAGWVAEHGEPLLVRHAQRDPRFSPAYDQATGVTTESILCVPLEVKGRVIGVVQALNKPRPGFTGVDVDVLRSLAASTAAAIENARLYHSLRESRDELVRRNVELKTVTKRLVRLQRSALALGALTIGADLKDVCAQLTEYAATLLDVKRSAILLHDPERQALVCQESAFGMGIDSVCSYRIPLGSDSPIWDAWENGQSLVVNNLTEFPSLEALGLTEQVAQGSVRSIMFAPLRLGGHSIGLFQVSDKLDGGDFTVDDQRVLEILALQGAIAIANARQLAQR